LAAPCNLSLVQHEDLKLDEGLKLETSTHENLRCENLKHEEEKCQEVRHEDLKHPEDFLLHMNQELMMIVDWRSHLHAALGHLEQLYPSHTCKTLPEQKLHVVE
jgi:hypothetical protein